jgi:hypothetical protein
MLTWICNAARNHHIFTLRARVSHSCSQLNKIILAGAVAKGLELGLSQDLKTGCFSEAKDKFDMVSQEVSGGIRVAAFTHKPACETSQPGHDGTVELTAAKHLLLRPKDS